MHKSLHVLSLLQKALSMQETSSLGETQDSNLKLCIWPLRTYQWKASRIIPLAGLQSIAEAGGMGFLAFLHFPCKSNSPCREGRQPLHPLSCWKDKLMECLKANCVLCALLPGSPRDKRWVCSLQWSYVHVSIFGHCG